MDKLVVEPDAIRRYGELATEVATKITAAGSIDLGANLAAMGPAFGAVGTDFLAVFAMAQANHAKAVSELAGHYVVTAAAATASAAGYEGVDAARAAELGKAGGQL